MSETGELFQSSKDKRVTLSPRVGNPGLELANAFSVNAELQTSS